MKLTPAEVDAAARAIDAHGYGDFFPAPPEWGILRSTENWADVRDKICSIDLDTYRPCAPLKLYAPKSRLLVRPAHLLHPYDVLILTSIVRALRDRIEGARDPIGNRRVLGFRAPQSPDAPELFTTTPGYADFKRGLRRWAEEDRDCYIGITDISDFFPRLYRHRLENALQEVAGRERGRDLVRCLEKMLSGITMDERSYGIPVGHPFAWLLGEADLIDLDSYLISEQVEFVRYVDDIAVRGGSEAEVREVISRIAQFLDTNHNLSLNSGKTRVLRGVEIESHPVGGVQPEVKEMIALRSVVLRDPEDRYTTVSFEDLTEEQRGRMARLNLEEMLARAMDAEPMDYEDIAFILKRSSVIRNEELIPIVLENLEKLAVVASAVAQFFIGFPALDGGQKRDIGRAILAQIHRNIAHRSGDYYAVWLLSVFEGDQDWNHTGDLSRILREAQTAPVRRQAALALACGGKRGDVLAVKEMLAGQHPLVRSACLLAGRRLAKDERTHWVRSLGLSDPLEKACGRTAPVSS